MITTVNNPDAQRRDNQNRQRLEVISPQKDGNKLRVDKKSTAEKYQTNSQADEENESEGNDQVHSFFEDKGNINHIINIRI
jgi:hypothetical protein